VPKFTAAERTFIKSLVATLSIKRIPDAEIIRDRRRDRKKWTVLSLALIAATLIVGLVILVTK